MDVRQAPAGQQEAAVEARSAELRKELSVRDLAFAQILFIVGLQWVGFPVGSRTAFALKIVGLIVLTNLIGIALYAFRARSVDPVDVLRNEQA